MREVESANLGDQRILRRGPLSGSARAVGGVEAQVGSQKKRPGRARTERRRQ